jgi:prolyl-tRNA synthetase
VAWELKGVPVRVEVGPRDLVSEQVTLVRRDRQEKRLVTLGAVAAEVAADLDATQQALYAEASARQTERTQRVATLDEAEEAAAEGFAVLPWVTLGVAGESRLAADGFSVRCLQAADGSLAGTDDEPGLLAVVARAY